MKEDKTRPLDFYLGDISDHPIYKIFFFVSVISFVWGVRLTVPMLFYNIFINDNDKSYISILCTTTVLTIIPLLLFHLFQYLRWEKQNAKNIN